MVAHWRRLNRLGTAVLIVHHLTKPKDGYSGAHRVRGAGSWANAARAVYLLDTKDGGLLMTCEKLDPRCTPASRRDRREH